MCYRITIATCLLISLFVANATGAATQKGERGFRVVRAEPQGALQGPTLKGELQIRVEFSGEVVSAADVGSSVPAVLELTPFVQAVGTWKDSKTYVLKLDGATLPSGTEFRYRVLPSLKDRRGRSLEAPREFSFVTPPFMLLGARQAVVTRGSGYAVQLEFSHAVNPDELMRYVTVKSGDRALSTLRALAPTDGKRAGARVRAGVATRTPVLEFSGPLEGDTVTVEIAPGLAPARGGRPIEQPAKLSVRVESAFVPVLARGSWRGEHGIVRIEFTAPVSLEEAADNIAIEPPVKFSVDRRWGMWVQANGENALVLSGDFKPETRYAITLKKGLKSAEGQPLREERTLSVWMPKVAPFLTLDNVGGHLSPQGTMKIRVRSSGVKQFTARAWRLYDNNLAYYVSRSWEEGIVQQLGTLLGERTIAVATPEKPSTTYVDLRDFLSTGSVAGVCLIQVEADYPPEAPEPADEDDRYRRYSGLRDEAVVALSNLGVVGKCGASEAVVWVTALDRAEPVAGASVQWLTEKNQPLGEAVTDQFGFARLGNLSAEGERRPAIVVVRAASDVTFLDLRRGQLALSSEQSLSSERPFLSRGYEAFATCDRGAYRPGETVHIAGFVRGVDQLPPKSAFPLELLIKRPDGVKLEPQRIVPSPSGAFETQLALPKTAPTGLWKGTLRLPGSEVGTKTMAVDEIGDEVAAEPGALGRVEFYVEEFMPSRLEVGLDVPSRRLSTSEPLTLRVRANELFGQPAAERPFSVSILYKAEPFSCPTFADYQFGDASRQLDRTEESVEERLLDASGCAELTVPLHLTRAPAAVRAEIQAVVRDASGRSVTKREVRIIDPVPYYVGVRLGSSSSLVPLGKPLECRITAVRPDCELAVDVKELSATVYRVVWDSLLKRSGEGYTFATTQRLIPQVGEKVPLKGGEAHWQWTPSSEGEYVLVVAAPDGGAQTRVPFFVSSGAWDEQPWSLEKPEQLELVPDKPAYAPGDVARIVVKAPFAGTLFVALEQDRVTSVSLYPVQSNTAEIQVPIEANMAPNVFVSAMVVRPVRPANKWLPHRAFGILSLPVRRAERQLAVGISAPPRVGPAETFEAEVSLADVATSAPVEGDAVVWAVDEGVLALTEFATPDPWKFFYGPRRLGVRTSDFYSELMPDLLAVAASAPGGGEGAAMRRLSPVAAERIRPVVLWHGLVRTDGHGRARVKFTLPSYAGKLRVMAVAAAGPRFGCAESPVIVSGPVVVREHLPRFLSPTDEAYVPLVVYNNTDEATMVQVLVTAVGPVEIRGSGAWEQSTVGTTTTLSAALNVPARGQQVASLVVRGVGKLGVASVKVAARLGAFVHEESVDLAVRPAALLERRAGYGVVAPGQKAKLEWPADYIAGTTSGTVTFGGSRRSALIAALQYNMSYPYGCAEQVISSAFPLLAVAQAPELRAEAQMTSEGVAALVAAACEHLAELQTPSGGLAMWPGQREPWLWASLYGLHFWLEARRAGYAVGEDQLEALERFVRSEAFRENDGAKLSASQARERAYGAYVLALANKPARDQMELLYDRREELPLGASALLAAAYWRLGMPHEAKQLLAAAPDEVGERELGRTLASPVREAAVLLATLTDVEPQAPRTRALAERLYAQLKPAGHWGTTQDNAFAVWALAHYENRQPASAGGTGLIRWMGTQREFDIRQGLALGLEQLTAPMEVEAKGPGALYYSWWVEGVPTARQQAVESQGLVLQRRYLDTKGRAVDPQALRQGDAVIVELSLKADRPAENVVLVDLLPSCFEIENPHLETAEHFGQAGSENQLLVDRTEARDDRMIVFGSVGQAGKELVWRYACRVVAAGQFVAGPASAECMYDPDVRARTASLAVKVVPTVTH
jgi:uncharacterized protein YfaS (alpha-2-macroglobulin family)